MQAIAVPTPSNNRPPGAQTPSPQPSYVEVTNGGGTVYQEYEFVDQTPSPVPSNAYQVPEGYVPAPVEQKSGYPDVYAPRRARYVRVESVQPPNKPPRSSFGIISFFRRFFEDEEGDSLEKAIVEEAKRIADLEEAIENEQVRLDRQERREAWEMIQRITEEQVKINAIQAEISRAQLFWVQTSERRSQRAVQREKAREELQEYRSQRALIRKLKALSIGVTAVCIFYTVRRLTPGAPGPNKSASVVSKVLVPKNNPQGQGAPAQVTSGQSSCSRKCSW
jgi:hypothetical protein